MFGLSKCKPVLQLQDHFFVIISGLGERIGKTLNGINVKAREAVVDM